MRKSRQTVIATDHKFDHKHYTRARACTHAPPQPPPPHPVWVPCKLKTCSERLRDAVSHLRNGALSPSDKPIIGTVSFVAWSHRISTLVLWCAIDDCHCEARLFFPYLFFFSELLGLFFGCFVFQYESYCGMLRINRTHAYPLYLVYSTC